MQGLGFRQCANGRTERAVRGRAARPSHPARGRPEAQVRVARVADRGKARISVVGPAALLGARVATRRRVPRAPTAVSAGAPPGTRLHERAGRRHRADAWTRRHSLDHHAARRSASTCRNQPSSWFCPFPAMTRSIREAVRTVDPNQPVSVYTCSGSLGPHAGRKHVPACKGT